MRTALLVGFGAFCALVMAASFFAIGFYFGETWLPLVVVAAVLVVGGAGAVAIYKENK